LSRSFRTAVAITPEEIERAIAVAADRRMAGLLVAARKARSLTPGADATREGLSQGSVDCVLVARDAGSIATRHWLTDAVAAGKAIAWGDKATLGGLLARGETAVVGISGVQFSAAMRQAASLASLASTVQRSADAPALLEVR
jgi:ribosomal protein L7Ae-like RNA K-turn-binding protein